MLVRAQSGQASVEMVATLPALLLVAVVLVQFALTAEALWLCANAARVAARAAAVGADEERAARSALPRSLEPGLEVDTQAGGAVRVRVRVPLLSRRWRSPLSVAASARLEPEP